MDKKLVSKDLVWKGLRMELSGNEMRDIMQQECEKDKYYDFDLMLQGFKKALTKEIDFDYYIHWCILVAHCLNYSRYSSPKINALIDEIAYFFDGCSFDDDYNKKSLQLNIALLKNFNHEFENLTNKTNLPFETNGVERILLFDHSNWTLDSRVYRAIIIDNNKRQFELKYVDDAFFEYDENINYTFVDESQFDDKSLSFYDEKTPWQETHNLEF